MLHGNLLLRMEGQAGWMASHHPGWKDAQTCEAYMLAGLRLAYALDPRVGDEYEGFTPEVWKLHQRVLGTCHPAFNPQVAAAADGSWRTPEDRRFHFRRGLRAAPHRLRALLVAAGPAHLHDTHHALPAGNALEPGIRRPPLGGAEQLPTATGLTPVRNTPTARWVRLPVAPAHGARRRHGRTARSGHSRQARAPRSRVGVASAATAP